MRNEILSWSILAPTPQCYYHTASQQHIVYWQGIAMLRAHAMIIIQSNWLGAYPSPTMKTSVYDQFKKAYLLGAFGEVNWDFTLKSMDANTHITQLRKWVTKHNKELLKDLKEKYTIQEAMSWFCYEEIINE